MQKTIATKDIKLTNGLFERLFWNKGKFLAQSNRFGDKVEYVFWFSKTDKRFNMDLMRLEYDEKSIKRQRTKKRFRRELDEKRQNTNKVARGHGHQNQWVPLQALLLKRER